MQILGNCRGIVGDGGWIVGGCVWVVVVGGGRCGGDWWWCVLHNFFHS